MDRYRQQHTIRAVTDRLNDGNENVSTIQGSPLSGNLLENVSDDDSTEHSVTTFSVNGTTSTAGETVTIPDVGTLLIESNGDYTFTPEADYYE